MLGKLKHLEKTHRCKSVSGLVEADMRAATGPHVLEPVQLISPVFPQLFLYYLKLFFFASNQFGEGSCKSFHGPGENISAAGNNFWQWVLHDPAPIFDVILENPGSSFELAVHLTEAAQIHLKSMFWSWKLKTHEALWFWKIKLHYWHLNIWNLLWHYLKISGANLSPLLEKQPAILALLLK